MLYIIRDHYYDETSQEWCTDYLKEEQYDLSDKSDIKSMLVAAGNLLLQGHEVRLVRASERLAIEVDLDEVIGTKSPKRKTTSRKRS